MARGRKKSFENWLSEVERKRDERLFPKGEKGPCSTCEFCFEDDTCAGAHYGEHVDTEDSTPRDCWSIGLPEYADRLAKDEKNTFSQEELLNMYQEYLNS